MHSSKAVGWGSRSLGTSRNICAVPFRAHLQGKSGKNFILDAVGVEFGGLRRRQSFAHEMRVDEHFSHDLVLLYIVLMEIKESFQ